MDSAPAHWLAPVRKALFLVLACLALIVPAGSASGATIVSGTSSITAGDPTQTGRLFRDGVRDTCGAPDTVIEAPIGGTFHYDLWEIGNANDSRICADVQVNVMSCNVAPNQLYTGAYSGSFNSGSINTDLLGSSGGSPTVANGIARYSVAATARRIFLINVHEVTANGGCPAYGLLVTSRRPWAYVAPLVSGGTSVGDTLSASDGVWAGSPSLTKQWLSCDTVGENCTEIPGATGMTYTLQASDSGKTVRVRETANQGGHFGTSTSEPTGVIGGLPGRPKPKPPRR